MLYQGHLREEWHARERVAPISAAMTFAREGLVMGAGTVLVAAEGVRLLKSLKGQEQRILALLSTAYAKAVSPLELGHIERAGRAWSKGDDCLAYIHLAHTRLQAPEEARLAACRLFMADRVMTAGESLQVVHVQCGGISQSQRQQHLPMNYFGQRTRGERGSKLKLYLGRMVHRNNVEKSHFRYCGSS